MVSDIISDEAPRASANEDGNESSMKEVDVNASSCSLISSAEEQCENKLSKRALKKQKKAEKYLEMKAFRKLRRKQLRKDQKERRKLSGVKKESSKVYSMADSKHKYSVVLDLSFENLMNSKDMAKCAHQIGRCYAANRRNPNPIQLHLCSFDNEMKKEISKIDGYDKWDIHFHEPNYLTCFEKERIVYLTSDSRNVLERLDDDKVYIIGAFVDHNLHKGVSLKKAIENGLETARLPLHKNIVMTSGTVLAINHVFEIILEVANGASWRDACMKVIPPRKIASTRPGANQQNDDDVNQVETNKCAGEAGDESNVSVE